jgi:hypothetical protein
MARQGAGPPLQQQQHHDAPASARAALLQPITTPMCSPRLDKRTKV